MLRESRSAEVIEELTKLRDGGEYPTVRADIQGEIDYLTANQKRMDWTTAATVSWVCPSAAVRWRARARTWSPRV